MVEAFEPARVPCLLYGIPNAKPTIQCIYKAFGGFVFWFYGSLHPNIVFSCIFAWFLVLHFVAHVMGLVTPPPPPRPLFKKKTLQARLSALESRI